MMDFIFGTPGSVWVQGWQVEGIRKASPVERPSSISKNCLKAKGPQRGRRHRCDESDNHSLQSSRLAGRKNVALAYRPLLWHGGPHPHAVSQADAPFFHLAPARPASSDARRERLSDSFDDQAQLALRAVSLGPESDFSGRCDRDCGANALHLPSVATHAQPGEPH